jgi:hypothetical protein
MGQQALHHTSVSQQLPDHVLQTLKLHVLQMLKLHHAIQRKSLFY